MIYDLVMAAGCGGTLAFAQYSVSGHTLFTVLRLSSDDGTEQLSAASKLIEK